MADQIILTSDAEGTQSFAPEFLYRVAKRHGPLPQRRHWRQNRTGWVRWIASDNGTAKVVQAVSAHLAQEVNKLKDMVAFVVTMLPPASNPSGSAPIVE